MVTSRIKYLQKECHAIIKDCGKSGYLDEDTIRILENTIRTLNIYRDIISDIESHVEALRSVKGDLLLTETLQHIQDLLDIAISLE